MPAYDSDHPCFEFMTVRTVQFLKCGLCYFFERKITRVYASSQIQYGLLPGTLRSSLNLLSFEYIRSSKKEEKKEEKPKAYYDGERVKTLAPQAYTVHRPFHSLLLIYTVFYSCDEVSVSVRK
jgi:hypothetical protein